MRLTVNQQAVLGEVAVGTPSGRDLVAIPSLIKRGLVTSVTFPGLYHEPTRTWVRKPSTEYRLTPLGLEVYTSQCEAWRDSALEKVHATFQTCRAQAVARTVK